MKRFAARVALAVTVAWVPVTMARGDQAIEYNRDVRPILAENCFQCHGPDSASRKGDLRLDRRGDAVKAEAIQPGDPDASELIQRILSDDRDEAMPPPATKKTLTAEQKQVLKRWIATGAEYQPHWSLIAPQGIQPPTVKNTGWVKNSIDRFVLSKLEAAGLAPAPEADRRTLARRLSLDLTGLPPEPAVVNAFVRDTAPDAYERFVDQLMSSAQWGEHRGRYWLDAARYGDTHGIHIDNFREMWAYRDWVINAFNRNLPFDVFTVEQLAGDLLPTPTLDQKIASGFNRCNITTSEGGAIAEEYLVLYTRDRTETTSAVWMGLTANCAVCHDHKFDPISQKEFYSLAAFFNNTTQAAMDGNIKDTPPTLVVPQASERGRWDALGAELTGVRGKLEARKVAARAEFDKWVASGERESVAALVPNKGLRFHAALGEGTGTGVGVTVDGNRRTIEVASAVWEPGFISAHAYKAHPQGTLVLAEPGDFEKDQKFSYGAWVKIPAGVKSGAIVARMDDQHAYRGWDLWVEDGRIATHIIHRWEDDALKVVTQNPLTTDKWTHVFVTYDGSGKGAGVQLFVDGQSQVKQIAVDRLKNTIRTTVPLKLGQRDTASRIDGLLVADLRIYDRALPGDEVATLMKTTRASGLLAKAPEQRTAAEKDELFTWWLAALDRETMTLAASVGRAENEQAGIRGRGTIAHVMQERAETPMAHILHRGDYDKRRDAVVPATPAALPALPSDLPRNRLGLAQWLLRPEHPLTARVTVNRFWQEAFGSGLVRTSGDFGVTGELPSHPELLDWLALEFRDNGWDVKRFFKLLVTSATYRQAALVSPEKLSKDPSNRLLSRGPRFRMDAEMVRDYALASSGLLVGKLGGPSVRPYQPDGVWEAVAMPGSNTRDYRRDEGENLYRRSMYTFWKRSAPPASMDIFNAPSREVCTVRRERTNTPLQALVTLNDPQFVEAARVLAQRALKEAGATPEDRAGYLAERLLSRPFRAEETRVVLASFDDLLAHYRAHADDAKALLAEGASKNDPAYDAAYLAAWTMVANELMNLDEVLTK